jgi:hypothetical protein
MLRSIVISKWKGTSFLHQSFDHFFRDESFAGRFPSRIFVAAWVLQRASRQTRAKATAPCPAPRAATRGKNGILPRVVHDAKSRRLGCFRTYLIRGREHYSPGSSAIGKNTSF